MSFYPIFLVLAQGDPEKAEATIDVLERVIQGGVPLICLSVAVVMGVALVHQYRVNNKLNEDFRVKIESLLRETLEVATSQHTVIDQNSDALKDLARGNEAMVAELAAHRERLAKLEGTARELLVRLDVKAELSRDNPPVN